MNYQSTKDKIYCAKHNLEYIKENVKKAYELELGFGCEVKVLTDDSDFYGKVPKEWWRVTVTEVSPKRAIITVLWSYPNPEIRYNARIEKKELKILGTPITLEDVLRAIHKKIDSSMLYTTSEVVAIATDDFGNFSWQLGKTFDDQSTEVRDFIKDLLK